MKPVFFALVGVFLFSMFDPSVAVQPDEKLEDPAMEARAREISKDLRCLVCQNQSIDDSDAELARDLRLLVRERLVEGDSNDQVFDFVVARYGDYVLLKPPIKSSTYVLWFAPFVLLLIAGTAIIFWLRAKAREHATALATQATGLSAEEEAQLSALLKDEKNGSPDKAGNE